jgi:RND family efflux transporter MFP subunit
MLPMDFVRRQIKRVIANLRGLSFWGKICVAALCAVLVIGGVYFFNDADTSVTAETKRLRSVSLAKINDLTNDSTPLPLIGQVKSVSQATIRAESGGVIKKSNYNLGSYVAAGAIIAEIENSSQKAAMMQAEGALESAQAGIDKSGKLFDESKRSTLNTIRSVYSSNDDLVRTKLDVLFTNPASHLPTFILQANDSGLVNVVQGKRLQIGQILLNQNKRAVALTESSDLAAELDRAILETRQIKDYIDDISNLLNKAIPSTTFSDAIIDGFVATAAASRTAISGSLASLTGASQALIAAQTSGDTPSSASASDAAIKTAQGARNAAAANLEKTFIRAPISGTLNSLSLELGDFVSPAQAVAVISNNSALEIVGQVTPDDRAQIKVGATALIEREYRGSVVSIAPAIDPLTKKIEIKIRFTGSTAAFTNGESVHLDIARTPKSAATKTSKAVPISAVKIQPEESVVFSVDASNRIVSHVVETGKLLGEKIEILSVIDPELVIVTDARGLKEGQEVSVQ